MATTGKHPYEDAARLVPLITLHTASYDDVKDCLWFGRDDKYVMRYVRLLGIVVNIYKHGFTLDDGSARVEVTNHKDDDDSSICKIELGRTVEVYGRILGKTGHVKALSFAVQLDPAFEPMRWLEIVQLHKNLYSSRIVEQQHKDDLDEENESAPVLFSEPQKDDWITTDMETNIAQDGQEEPATQLTDNTRAEINAATAAAMLMDDDESDEIASKAADVHMASPRTSGIHATPSSGQKRKQQPESDSEMEASGAQLVDRELKAKIDNLVAAAGDDGVDLQDIMMLHCSQQEKSILSETIKVLMQEGIIYENGERYYSL
eukprot:m.86960 g.86960  ORF g.86960 m.86960 type:complete len:319 (+) comp13078_c0_seq2:237-1193(+)